MAASNSRSPLSLSLSVGNMVTQTPCLKMNQRVQVMRGARRGARGTETTLPRCAGRVILRGARRPFCLSSRVTAGCTARGVTTEGVPTNESCTEFILVRHGETVWNAVGKMQGQLDIDLNEAGRQQAVAVAKRLSREPNISVIYSSDLKRALETAETIAATCGGLEVICDQDLRERHLGELQGVVYEESITKIYPKAHEALLSGEEIPGGGESHDQLYIRSIASLRRIAEKQRSASDCSNTRRSYKNFI